MTLYRQIFFSVLVCLVFLFCCFWLVQLNSTRGFLENQLQSNAQDTATSLGLSLSVSLEGGGGTAEMETMVNAIFDRGYFQAVVVRDIEDNILFSREVPASSAAIPAWFIRLFPISSPPAQALLMNGWSRAGRLEVRSNPGYGYQNLWESAKRATLWAFLSFILVAAAGSFVLKLLLRSLDKVEQQAIDLSNRQYHIQQKIPRTRELRRVVLAMNKMTAKVRDMFEEQTSVVEELRRFSYQDALTGMGNRRFFVGQLKKNLKEEGGQARIFFLLHVEGLQELNDQKGYKTGDELISNVASIIEKTMEAFPGVVCGRLSGSDFGILLVNSSEENAQGIAEQLQHAVQQLRAYEGSLAERVSCVGGVIFNGSVTIEEILSKGDEALRNSLHSGTVAPNIIDIVGAKSAPALARTRLQEIVQYALAEKKIALKCRKTVRNAKEMECVQYEILSQFFDEEDNVLSAELLMPVAEQFGLMVPIDRLVIEKVLTVPPSVFCGKTVTVNLSAASVADDDFVCWLERKLRRQSAGGLKFNFEMPEFLVSAHLEEIAAFGKKMAVLGHGMGVDHFGQGLVRFGYLQTLQPDYIKIDRALTQELIEKESDVYFFIRSLCTVAHSLDIRVMVDGVENEQQRNLLMELNIDAVQGFYIDKPMLLEDLIASQPAG